MLKPCDSERLLRCLEKATTKGQNSNIGLLLGCAVQISSYIGTYVSMPPPFNILSTVRTSSQFQAWNPGVTQGMRHLAPIHELKTSSKLNKQMEYLTEDNDGLLPLLVVWQELAKVEKLLRRSDYDDATLNRALLAAFLCDVASPHHDDYVALEPSMGGEEIVQPHQIENGI